MPCGHCWRAREKWLCLQCVQKLRWRYKAQALHSLRQFCFGNFPFFISPVGHRLVNNAMPVPLPRIDADMPRQGRGWPPMIIRHSSLVLAWRCLRRLRCSPEVALVAAGMGFFVQQLSIVMMLEAPGIFAGPNVGGNRATTAGRQARAGENVPRTTGPGLVACRWRSG